MRFSYSSVRRWLSCERAWSYAYVDRLVPLRQRRAFDVGKYVHALLEHALLQHANTGHAQLSETDAKRAYTALSNEENIQLEETEVVACLAAARENLTWLDLDQWETVHLSDGTPGVELGGTVPWRGHELTFRIDWIAKSKRTGMVWVIDHKSTRTSIDELQGFIEFDLQLALYQDAARVLGLKVDGAMVNMLRVSKSVEPRRLKSGAFSRDKSKSAMPWRLYERVLLDANLDPEDYADMREALQARTWNMWRPDLTSDAGRESVLANCEAALARMDEAVDARRRMAFKHHLATRLPGVCERCEYRSLCDYQFDGRDIAPMIPTLFRPRDDKSPWATRRSFDSAALADHFARSTGVGRFNVANFQP